MKYLNHFLPPEMKQFLSNRRRDTHMNWYESASDWEQELERCGATGWRVSSVNDRFEMSTRYNGIVANTSLFLCYISVFPNILSSVLSSPKVEKTWTICLHILDKRMFLKHCFSKHEGYWECQAKPRLNSHERHKEGHSVIDVFLKVKIVESCWYFFFK